MANKGTISMLSLYQNINFKELKFLSKLTDLQDILSQQSLKPENIKDAQFDPNDYIVQSKPHFNKKKPVSHQQKQIKITRNQQKKYEAQEKKKIYKKGPFAEFYSLNQSVFDKDAEVWYYKDGKQIIGPVSSYDMDKMVYHKTINSQTRVAFKSIQKFVKFAKIQKVLEDAKQKQEQQEKVKQQQKKQQTKVVNKQVVEQKVEQAKQQEKPVEKVETKPAKFVLNLDDPNEFPSL